MPDAKIITYGELISATTDVVPDNQTVALDIESLDGKEYVRLDTTDGTERLILGNGDGGSGIVPTIIGNYSSNRGGFPFIIDNGSQWIEMITGETNKIKSQAATNFQIGTHAAHTLELITANTARLHIAANGKVFTTGAVATALTGTFTATQGSDVINAGSSTAFTTELHVGSAIKIPSDVAAGFEIFTVDGITSDTILSLDSNYLGSTRATSGGAFTDGGELFAVKTGDSKSILSVNATGVLGLSTEPDAGTVITGNNLGIGDPNMFDAVTTMNRMTVIGNCRSNNTYSFVGGDSCVIIGFEAGHSSVTAQNSVFVGSQCADGANHIDQAVIIGQGAGQTSGDHSVHIGFTAGTAATGTNNVSVGSGALVASGSQQNCVAVGMSALAAATGNSNIGIGKNAGNAIVGGSSNILIGSDSDGVATDSNQIAIGGDAVTDASNKVRLGNTSVTNIDGEVEFNATSDVRTKANIEELALGLDFINALRPVSFTRVHPAEYPAEILDKRYKQGQEVTDKEGNVSFISTPSFDVETGQPIKDEFDEIGRSDGLIAQEVQAVCDSLGLQFNGINTSGVGKLGLQYGLMVAPLIKAVQELTARIEELENDG